MNNSEPVMWTRDTAHVLLGRLEALLYDMGAHTALSGSVCHRGASAHDLDVIVYPHNKSAEAQWDIAPIKAALATALGCELNDTSGDYRDAKLVSWAAMPDGRRVDFFFLQ